jgi:hypothetical protein
MVHSDGNLLRVAPTKIVLESLPLSERLRLLKQLAMIYRFPKRPVSLREKPP